MSEIKIREAKPGDAKPVLDLLPTLGYAVDPARTSAFLDAFNTVVRHPEITIYVATDGLRLAGYATVSVRPQLRLGGRVACIDELVVHPDYGGHGLGTRLLEAAIDRAREHRCVRIELHTRRSRDSFQRGFYKKRGFAEAESAVLRMELL